MEETKNNLNTSPNSIDWENLTTEEYHKLDLELSMAEHEQKQKEWAKSHIFDYVGKTVPLEDC